MADIVTLWSDFLITDKGLNLRQRVISTGEAITFDYAKIGQGIPVNPADIPLMTDVVMPAEQVPVVRSEANGPSHYVGVRIDNISFTQPILMREIGLFASINGETPILYGYTYATQGYDSIPTGSVSHYVWTVGIDTVISRAHSISFIYDGAAVYATYDDIDQLIQAFDTFKSQVELVSSGVIFSQTRPTGGWTLWLQDLGEITGLPDSELDNEVDGSSLILETAPLDAPGDFAVEDDNGNAETVINMTDNPETASDTDVILADS